MSEAISLLMPQSCKPIRLGGAYGLSGIDIAHALATVRNGDDLTHEIGHAIINIKYNDDRSYFDAVQILLYRRVYAEAKKEKWKQSKIPLLIQLSINEHCGSHIYRDAQRAALIGVSPSCWCRVWKSKYRHLLDILEYTEQGLMRQVKKKLLD